MEKVIIELISAFIGTFGYALLFQVRRRLLVWTSAGAVLAWSVYLILQPHVNNIFISCMIASVVAAIYSEVMARLHKVPATGFLILALIPSFPGGSLYYTMLNAVQKNWMQAWNYGVRTLEFGIAIAVGISLVWAVGVILVRISQNNFTI